MALPTFNSFSLNDDNFISERIVVKGYANREVIRGKINRREGVKLLATEFGEKEVTIEGMVLGSSAANLQSLLDDMKKALTAEEGNLIVELDRTFKATVTSLAIPDEHYNLTKAPFQITFMCSNPYAEGSLLTVTIPVISGIYTVSGLVNISGSLFARPTLVYTPPSNTGQTFIKSVDLAHISEGTTTTVSGFGNQSSLDYSNQITINLDDFTALEGTSAINVSGGFPRFQPGNNEFTYTASGRAFPGGSLTLSYKPRYL